MKIEEILLACLREQLSAFARQKHFVLVFVNQCCVFIYLIDSVLGETDFHAMDPQAPFSTACIAQLLFMQNLL